MARQGATQNPRWWFLSERSRKAVFRWLRVRFIELLARVRQEVERRGGLLPAVADERFHLWNGALQLTEVIGPQENPRLPFHFLCLAFARHPHGSCYSLASA